MPIDFHLDQNRYTYASRLADESWAETIESVSDPAGKRVADIGCGGGIYSLAWHRLGASEVIGVDFSAQMVATARERSADLGTVSFRQGNAAATGLPALSSDIVFERALIHHLPRYDACFAEAARVLVPGGLLIVQDRTPEDVEVPGAAEHVRGYFFERFPRLRSVERVRRPTRPAVEQALRALGFENIQTRTLWEIRERYADFDRLAADLAARAGRSILHELGDAELQELIAYIGEKLPAGPIVEKDRWTLWAAAKPN